MRRTHLRGQKSVENDIGLVLMSMNLVKLGKMIAQFSTKYIENIKIRLQNFEQFKIWSRIIFFHSLRGKNYIFSFLKLLVLFVFSFKYPKRTSKNYTP